MDLKTLSSIGGKARAKKLTRAQRREISRKGGIAARRMRHRKLRKSKKTKRVK